MDKDKKEEIALKEGPVTSDVLPNAHASGDGTLERSEENCLGKAEADRQPPKPETPY